LFAIFIFSPLALLIIAQCTGLRIPIVTVALPIEREQKDVMASLIQRDIRKAIAVIP